MKKLNKFKILSLIILLFCFCITFCFAEEKKGYQSETDYAPFVKNASALGFRPDYSLFVSALNQMQQKFIENPTEQKLIAGINRELNILFKTAKINQSAHISSINTISSEVASLSASLMFLINRRRAYPRRPMIIYCIRFSPLLNDSGCIPGVLL